MAPEALGFDDDDEVNETSSVGHKRGPSAPLLDKELKDELKNSVFKKDNSLKFKPKKKEAYSGQY